MGKCNNLTMADFEEQLSGCYQQLFSTAFLYLKNYHDAEDALQDTVLAACKNIFSLRQPCYFKTWITRILMNCCYKKLTIRKRGQTTALEMDCCPSNAPDDVLCLETAIQSLDDKDRDVILLRYFSDMTISEIAKTLHLPQGTVKSRLSRSIQKMRPFFKEELG